ncbi:hypothetical protein [Xanthomonas phage SB3]|uniref:Terminase small subunit n=1 Tax=Xanthomonas phage SB3 TaxID=3117472 RepID=A0ABZ2GUG0_9CAUD
MTAQIERNIAFIAKAGVKLDKLIQTTAEAVLLHSHQHREVSLVNKLYNALSKGARHAAMTEWLISFCPVVANTDDSTKKERPFVFNEEKCKAGEELVALAGQASGMPWYEMKKSPAPDDVFDVKAAILALIRKAGKAGENTDPVTLHQLEVLASTAKGKPEKAAA